jgi:hypothetical protein
VGLMLQRLLTWTLLAAIWKRYGRALRMLPLLIGLVVLITMMHGDYVEYVSVSDNKRFLHWSFLIKWLLIVLVVFLYWRYVLNVIKGNSVSLKNDHSSQSSLGKNNGPANKNENGVDPFENIRSKKTLKSKAEVIIEKKN